MKFGSDSKSPGVISQHTISATSVQTANTVDLIKKSTVNNSDLQ